MPRVLGVDIPAEKKIGISLRYIYGIGPTNTANILEHLGINWHVRAKDLTDDELSKIASYIEKNYVIEGGLRRQIAQNITRLKEIGSYRGARHRRGLPVRGQRTRTNSRTRKGPRRTVAGKKGVKEMRG
jgi:small subunit ribosomal protein S13